jgi:hypothetical protein
MNRTRVFDWRSLNSPRHKNARQVKSQVKNMLIIIFEIKKIVHVIRPGMPHSQFHILLSRLTATA